MSALPDPVDVSDLPIDQLGLMMLGKFAEGGGWNSRNLMLELNEAGYRDEAGDAMAEAFAWLGNRGLVAPDPRKNEWTAVTTTRLGQQVLADGPAVLHATERLQDGLHPLIEAKARRQFLMGEYEQAVFVSMKAVEVRVRTLAGFGGADRVGDLVAPCPRPALVVVLAGGLDEADADVVDGEGVLL